MAKKRAENLAPNVNTHTRTPYVSNYARIHTCTHTQTDMNYIYKNKQKPVQSAEKTGTCAGKRENVGRKNN